MPFKGDPRALECPSKEPLAGCSVPRLGHAGTHEDSGSLLSRPVLRTPNVKPQSPKARSPKSPDYIRLEPPTPGQKFVPNTPRSSEVEKKPETEAPKPKTLNPQQSRILGAVGLPTFSSSQLAELCIGKSRLQVRHLCGRTCACVRVCVCVLIICGASRITKTIWGFPYYDCGVKYPKALF